MPHYAVGSCHIMRQAPGAERVGGLEIKICPRRGEAGQIEVRSTDWRTDEPLEESMEIFGDAAIEGIKLVADRYGISLGDFDITLQRFLYHPTDSGQLYCYRQAGRSAFRSAIEGLTGQELQ